jgi:hypothetical protein
MGNSQKRALTKGIRLFTVVRHLALLLSQSRPERVLRLAHHGPIPRQLPHGVEDVWAPSRNNRLQPHRSLPTHEAATGEPRNLLRHGPDCGDQLPTGEPHTAAD